MININVIVQHSSPEKIYTDKKRKIQNLTFEKVRSFIFLGVYNVLYKQYKIMHEEIKGRLTSANKCYYIFYTKSIKSRNLSHD